jgi:hypothetical protein
MTATMDKGVDCERIFAAHLRHRSPEKAQCDRRAGVAAAPADCVAAELCEIGPFELNDHRPVCGPKKGRHWVGLLVVFKIVRRKSQLR